MIARATPKKRKRAKTGQVRILALDKIFPSPENKQLYRPVDPADPARFEIEQPADPPDVPQEAVALIAAMLLDSAETELTVEAAQEAAS